MSSAVEQGLSVGMKYWHTAPTAKKKLKVMTISTPNAPMSLRQQAKRPKGRRRKAKYNMGGAMMKLTIEVVDDRDFEPGRAATGGGYMFYRTYTWHPERGLFSVDYGTSAELGYCKWCGCFSDKPGKDCCYGEVQFASAAQLSQFLWRREVSFVKVSYQ